MMVAQSKCSFVLNWSLFKKHVLSKTIPTGHRKGTDSREECFMSGHLRSTLGPCFCFYPNFDHWKTKDSSKFHICQNTVWGAPSRDREKGRQRHRGDSEFYYSHLPPCLALALLPLSWAGFSLRRNPVKLSAATRPLLWSGGRLRVTLGRKYIHTLSFPLHLCKKEWRNQTDPDSCLSNLSFRLHILELETKVD